MIFFLFENKDCENKLNLKIIVKLSADNLSLYINSPLIGKF